jgi:hypothetical protein
MIRLFLLASLTISLSSSGQPNVGFPFGQVTYEELGMTTYNADTNANAVVLYELGDAYIDNGNDYNLIFSYHAKIKILNKGGLAQGDFEIQIGKRDDNEEVLKFLKASSFNMENGSILEMKVDRKNIFTQDAGKYGKVVRFAIPNVKPGSVIEVEYTIESPFIYNFRQWKFQSEIPKVHSEYWASIPGNYLYNMSLKGFLELSKNENDILKDCFSVNGGRADCVQYKFAMNNIPAFVEEEYMLAKSNYLACINFELSQIKYFDGRVKKFTDEWSDAELRLEKSDVFGAQLKKAKDLTEQIELLVKPENDDLSKAREIYSFVKDWYSWNEQNGMFTDLGIKKAFEEKKGNVADVNLSLIAALRSAGLSADPVILSTRKNGLPREIHPVLSDFNYVVARLTIGSQSFFLDATEDLYPFGMIPERCLNGKGRLLTEGPSSWVELKAIQKNKQITSLRLKISESGFITGTLSNSFLGYEGVKARRQMLDSEQEYINKLKSNFGDFEIKNVTLSNVADIDKPAVEKIELELEADASSGSLLIDPFLTNTWDSNPFKSNERSYPVDFGVPIEEAIVISIEYPKNYEVANLPEKIGLSLPNGGGRFMLDSSDINGVLTISSSLSIAKAVFSAEEYHYLKELFSAVVSAQAYVLLLKKK